MLNKTKIKRFPVPLLLLLLLLLLPGCAAQTGGSASPADASAQPGASETGSASAAASGSGSEPEQDVRADTSASPGQDPQAVPETPDTSETPDAAEETLPLSGRIICIDPGHCISPENGKGLTGPVSPLSDEEKPLYTVGTSGKNLSEVELNLIVGLKLRDALEELGAQVLMTREVSEITIDGIYRCEVANRAGADVNIHIHADGSDSSSANGVSVLVPDGDLLGTPSIVEESVRLGQLMVDAVAAETGAKNRGIIPRADMSGFNFSEVPAVLIEMGFMTNPEEDAKLETDDYQNQIVSGMVSALLSWFGVRGTRNA